MNKRSEVGDTPPAKKNKRDETSMTPQQVRSFLPQPAVEWVRSSAVCYSSPALRTILTTPVDNPMQHREEYMHRLQVFFAYLFYRCSHYSDSMLVTILSIVRPPILHSSAAELKDVQDMLLGLFNTIIRAHLRLTTHFITNTAYGSQYYETAEKNRRHKTKLPDLDVATIDNTLNLPVAVVRVLWYPLAAVVPAHLWESADTEILCQFRTNSAEIVSKTARVWSAVQDELSSHVQLSILKDLSPILFTNEWPPFSATGKMVRFLQNGVFAPQNVDAFLDQAFRPRDEADDSSDTSSEAPSETAQNSEDLAGSGQVAGTTQADGEDRHGHPGPQAPPADKENVSEVADIDRVIKKQINDALKSVDVQGRPLTFGSEFEETGGRGIGRKAMTEIMELNTANRDEIVQVLQDTGDSLLASETCFRTEESDAIATMSARANAKYAILRLERDNSAIMEAIWRMQQIVDQNATVLDEIKARIAKEVQKQKYFDKLSAEMVESSAAIDEEQRKLDKMTGMLDDTSDGEQTPKKANWRDRARNAMDGKAGMRWTYVPKQPKDKESSRLQTPMPATSVPSSLSNPMFTQPSTADDAKDNGESSVAEEATEAMEASQ
jgi:hypothetical protein